MMIKGTTGVLGLIGNPVGHSLSPIIHNEIAKDMGLDVAYVTFKVEDDVDVAVKGAYALGIKGLNVTVPHKEKVIDSLVMIDELAKKIGAVNTLVPVSNGYKGYNTDIIGIDRELCEANIDVKHKTVVLLGAGGACRAIAMLMSNKGISHMYILNRTIDKAFAIKDALNEHMNYTNVTVLKPEEFYKIEEKDYIVIQTSSVGLYPNIDKALIEDMRFYDNAMCGVDIIYNPCKTKFMKLMENAGKPAFNGLRMLIYQAVASFELWNNVVVPKASVDHVYDMLKKEFER